MNVHQLLGQVYHDYHTLHAEYRKLLSLLVQVQTGEVAKERVIVDLPGNSWSLLPEEKPTADVQPLDEA